MRLAELVEPYPTASLDSDAVEAVAAMAGAHRPGLIVLDDSGHPCAVLPGPQILAWLLPGYILDDPALSRVVDAETADSIVRRLEGRRVRDLMPPQKHLRQLPVLSVEDTSMEAAALMAATGTYLVAVVDGDEVVGAITSSRLIRRLLESSGLQP